MKTRIQPEDTLALLHAKNEIIALKQQINQIDETRPEQDYFVKFQREVDMFEKKLNMNIKGTTYQKNSKAIFDHFPRIANIGHEISEPDNLQKERNLLQTIQKSPLQQPKEIPKTRKTAKKPKTSKTQKPP